MLVTKSCGYAWHYSKPKSKQNTTKHTHILWNTSYIYWAFFANDNFLTNMISFQWNRSTMHGFVQDELWDYAFYLHNIANWGAHESTKNWYSKLQQNKADQTIWIFYVMYCVCSKGSIKSQRSLLLIWCPFDVSPLTKPLITWATFLEPII